MSTSTNSSLLCLYITRVVSQEARIGNHSRVKLKEQKMKSLLVIVFVIVTLVLAPMIITIQREHDDGVKKLTSDHKDIMAIINFHATYATKQREVLNQKLDILLNIATNINRDVRRSCGD